MLTLPSESPEPHAWTRQPCGTWMNAPLSAAPLRNMWIVLEPAGLLLPLVEADEDEDNGSKVVHSHYGNTSCQSPRYIVMGPKIGPSVAFVSCSADGCLRRI